MYKIAIIGSGYMAREYARAIHDSNKLKVIAAMARDNTKLENFAKDFDIPIIATTVEELYLKSKADLLLISSSVESLEILATQALNYPWEILMEKPPGINLNSANRLSKLSQQYRKTIHVALNRRFYSSVKNMEEKLNHFSEPRVIYVFDQQDTLKAKKMGYEDIVIENWHYANSIHLVDLILNFSRGEIDKITTRNVTLSSNSKIQLAEILFNSGDLVFYRANWNIPGSWAVEIYVENIALYLRPIETLSTLSLDSRNENKQELSEWDSAFKPGLREIINQIENLLSGLPSELTTIFESLKTMELISRIYE